MRFLILTLCCLGLVACSSSEPKSGLQSQQSAPVDFSGSWEMDYGRSDDINQKLNSIYRELQRQAQRAAQQQGRGMGNAAMINSSDLNRRMSRVIDLARFADLVSQSQVLTIEQGERDIRVEREGDYALNCGFYTDDPAARIEELGAEKCGWSGQRMVFFLSLPDGTQVRHIMSIAPDGERLHIATTVSAEGSGNPFTLNRFYFRFEPLPEDYSCEYTLTRGQVCTRNSS